MSSTYISVNVLKRAQFRTPVGSLEKAIVCCALLAKPYHSNDGAVLLSVCVAMGMLLHSNAQLYISTVADWLSMFTKCRKISWKSPTILNDVEGEEHYILVILNRLSDLKNLDCKVDLNCVW
jgi:hypothetical protein